MPTSKPVIVGWKLIDDEHCVKCGKIAAFHVTFGGDCVEPMCKVCTPKDAEDPIDKAFEKRLSDS